jgi:flagellar motor switch protein FliG
MSADGIEKSAILLMSLGEEAAASVFKHLGPREVQKLGAAMAAIKNVTRESIDGVVGDLHKAASERSSVGVDANEYVRTVLVKALGDDKASGLIDRILQANDNSGIEGLKWMDSDSVAELIKNEHPQILATILVHLDRDQASEVLAKFPEAVRNDVILRIATLDGIQPAALKELNDVLSKLLSGGNSVKKASMGGAKAAAEIMNFLSGSIEGEVIENIREHDGDLAQKILDEMFVFDNLLGVDDRGIQLILREVQSESLIVALKGASEELREKIFKNMSSRAAEMLREDLESKGPVRLSEVESEQKEILKLVRRLADEGQIALGGKGDDAFV